jgi:hypothetical protein
MFLSVKTIRYENAPLNKKAAQNCLSGFEEY